MHKEQQIYTIPKSTASTNCRNLLLLTVVHSLSTTSGLASLKDLESPRVYLPLTILKQTDKPKVQKKSWNNIFALLSLISKMIGLTSFPVQKFLQTATLHLRLTFPLFWLITGVSGENHYSRTKNSNRRGPKDVSDLALWSDGSKLESGEAGAAVVWKNSTSHRWDVGKISLGKNKEILDGQLWGISEALKIALKENTTRKARRITVFSDSQAAIKQLQGSKSNAGQALKIQILKRARQLHTHGGELIVRWIKPWWDRRKRAGRQSR